MALRLRSFRRAVVVYNGKPYQTKAPTLIFIASLNGQPAAELDFRVEQQPTGPYGLAFDDIDFPSTTPAPVHADEVQRVDPRPDRDPQGPRQEGQVPPA